MTTAKFAVTALVLVAGAATCLAQGTSGNTGSGSTAPGANPGTTAPSPPGINPGTGSQRAGQGMAPGAGAPNGTGTGSRGLQGTDPAAPQPTQPGAGTGPATTSPAPQSVPSTPQK